MPDEILNSKMKIHRQNVNGSAKHKSKSLKEFFFLPKLHETKLENYLAKVVLAFFNSCSNKD